jgi:beta-phosphoglucomutase-like phosphatase (HAD superfamily)
MIRAVIFDFNGVLADDDPIHMKALQAVAREEGLTISDDEYLETYLPLNDWDCFRTLFANGGRRLEPELCDDLIRRKSVYYYQAIAGRRVLFEGAPAAVKAAAASCYVAIASGARRDEVLYILEQGKLRECFSAIVAAEDVTHGKPDPEPFVRAWRRLVECCGPVSVSECVAVEDSIGGIESAHGANMRCLAIAHSYGSERLRNANADWIIESISDFPMWLKGEIRS